MVKTLIAMVVGAIQKCEVEIDWSHSLLLFCTLQLTCPCKMSLSLSFSLGFVMQDQGCKSDAGVKGLIAMVIAAIQKFEVEIDWSHSLLLICTLQLTSSVLARCE
jgi:hypothetical protein